MSQTKTKPGSGFCTTSEQKINLYSTQLLVSTKERNYQSVLPFIFSITDTQLSVSSCVKCFAVSESKESAYINMLRVGQQAV